MTDKVIAITEEQYKEYMKLKKKANKKVRRWKPEYGDQYWYADSDATCVLSRCFDDEFDLGRYKLGFVFRTKEEAQKDIDRRIAEQELLDMCDWDGKLVYYIIYNPISESFDVNLYNTFIPTPYRFESEESCKKAVDTLGTDKLKLIFRID